MRDNIGPVECVSINFEGSVRNLRKTSRRKLLMTLRPIQPSDHSVAKPARPRPMKTATKDNGSQRAVCRLYSTSVSSMSGSTSMTIAASIAAVAAIATTATMPMALCGKTYRHRRP